MVKGASRNIRAQAHFIHVPRGLTTAREVGLNCFIHVPSPVTLCTHTAEHGTAVTSQLSFTHCCSEAVSSPTPAAAHFHGKCTRLLLFPCLLLSGAILRWIDRSIASASSLFLLLAVVYFHYRATKNNVDIHLICSITDAFRYHLLYCRNFPTKQHLIGHISYAPLYPTQPSNTM